MAEYHEKTPDDISSGLEGLRKRWVRWLSSGSSGLGADVISLYGERTDREYGEYRDPVAEFFDRCIAKLPELYVSVIIIAWYLEKSERDGAEYLRMNRSQYRGCRDSAIGWLGAVVTMQIDAAPTILNVEKHLRVGRSHTSRKTNVAHQDQATDPEELVAL